ncbi:MAG TPA: proline iminopeptidase-family hydrolase [Mycobacteriales bacterium]|nr:proline iminopeptidase-family hydrolase [Mycobacteriales bacterium]
MGSVEGTVDLSVDYQGRRETHQTWYRVVGERVGGDPGAPWPVVVLHGGPGATHDYLLSTADLAGAAAGGRQVVLYDQLGNGRSTHRPDRGADFWTVELFVAELHNLIDALGLRAGHHVLGQSWGGFLAQEYALTHPAGLRSLVLADTASSFPDFVAEANRLRADLPAEVQDTLLRHERAGSTDDPQYAAACQVFYRRHVCRLDPWPAEVIESFDWIDRDPTVYHTMNGPSEFHVIGSIRDWSSTDRLGRIDVPTLLVSGRYDEATPALQQTLRDGILDCRWTLFEESAHMPHVEERDRYLRVVADWLRSRD